MKLTIVLKKQDAIGLGGQILEAMGMKRSVYEPEVFVAQHIADPRIIAPVDVLESMWPIMYVEALMDEGIRPVRVMQKDNSILGLTPLFASVQPTGDAVADLLDAAADALEAGCGCDDAEGVCACGASGIPGADGTCENCGLPMQMATDEAAVTDISVPMCRASAELSDEEAAAAVLLAGLKPFARAERLAQAGLGEYSAANPLIQALAKKGLVKLTKTTIIPDYKKTKAAVAGRAPPAAFKKFISNPFMWFTYPDSNVDASIAIVDGMKVKALGVFAKGLDEGVVYTLKAGKDFDGEKTFQFMTKSGKAAARFGEAAIKRFLAQGSRGDLNGLVQAAAVSAARAPKGTPTDINKFALNEYLNGKNAHMAPKGVITRVHGVDHPHLKRMVGAGWLEAAPGVKNGWVLSAIGKKGMDEWTAQQAAAAAKWAKTPPARTYPTPHAAPGAPAPDRWDGAPASLETSARDIPEGLSSQEARTISKHILSRYDWTDFVSATADDFRLAGAFIEAFEKENGKFQPIKIVPATHLSMTLGARVALIYEGWTDEAEKLQFSPEMEKLMRKLGSWFEAYNHWSATIYSDKKVKASTVKSSKGVIDMKTWKTIREKANDALEKAGFDGNGRFKNMGQANGKLADVLSKFGLQLGDVMSADLFREDSRTHNFSLEFVNPMDSFSPVAFDDSMMHFSYAKLSPDRIEVVAYLS